MAFTSSPVVGVALEATNTAASIGVSEVAPQLGTQVFGSDGKLYVYAEADGTINADDADCAVNATTFIASATGGAYLSPGVAMAVGDRGWFSKASV